MNQKPFQFYTGLGLVIGFIAGMTISIVFPDAFTSWFGTTLYCGFSVTVGKSCWASYQGISTLLGVIIGGGLGLIVAFIKVKLFK